MLAKLKERKHNTGVYFFQSDYNPITDIRTVEHTEADDPDF